MFGVPFEMGKPRSFEFVLGVKGPLHNNYIIIGYGWHVNYTSIEVEEVSDLQVELCALLRQFLETQVTLLEIIEHLHLQLFGSEVFFQLRQVVVDFLRLRFFILSFVLVQQLRLIA